MAVESTPGEGSRFTLRLSREIPYQLEIFSDLRCPFCHVLNEWLEASNLAHMVLWRGVEQRPGLTPEVACSAEFLEELDAELARLTELAPSLSICRPARASNTRRALAAVARITRQEPWRAASARNELYRAIWRDGREVEEWETIRSILCDFDLGDLDDASPEMEEVSRTTAEWRAAGVNRIPMLRSLTQTGDWHGLGQRSELLTFVDAQIMAVVRAAEPAEA
jgi:predicted DsbA family dithiol-disulfide isomerase